MEPQMNLEDALQLFMKRIDIIVSMEMGGKIPTKEAYKEIKDEVRKLKKNKKAIHHADVVNVDNLVQLDSWEQWLWYLVWAGNQWTLWSTEW